MSCKLFIVVIFMCIFPVFGQYKLHNSPEGKYATYQGDTIKDIEVVFDEEYGVNFIRKGDGKTAVFKPWANYSKELTWFDDFIHPKDLYNGEYVFEDYNLLAVRERGKIGMVQLFTQRVIIPPVNDSLIIREGNYSMELVFYKGNEITVIPCRFIDKVKGVKTFYAESIIPIDKFTNFMWEEEYTYAFKKEGKYGAFSYYIPVWGDTLNEPHIQYLMPCEMDTFYFYEDAYLFIAEKGGLKSAFDFKDLRENNPPEMWYSDIYVDEDTDMLIKVPPLSILKEKYPGITEVKQLNGKPGLYVLNRKDEAAVYDASDDLLIIPFKYDRISNHAGSNRLEITEDGNYAYLTPVFWDYKFVGYKDEPFYIFEEPADSQFFNTGDKRLYIEDDSVTIRIHSDEMYLSYKHGDFAKNILLHKLLKDIKDPEDQKQKLIEVNTLWKQEGKAKEVADKVKDIKLNYFGGKNRLYVYGNSKRQLDSLIDVHNLNDLKSIDRIELVWPDEKREFYDRWISNVSYFNEHQPAFFINGKKYNCDWAQLSESNYWVFYKNGKGKVYDQIGKRIHKLKKDERLIQINNGFIILEKWSYGDTIAEYQVRNPDGDIILNRSLKIKSDKSYWNNEVSYRYAIDSLKSLPYINTPFEFVSSPESDQLLIKTTRRFLEGNELGYTDQAYYDLKGNRLDVHDIEDNFYDFDHMILRKYTPRAEIMGIHNGYHWLIPLKYEDIVPMEYTDYSPTGEIYFQALMVGFKNKFGLYDANFKELLPCQFYSIHIMSFDGKTLKLEVLPEKTEQKEIIELTITE